MLNVLAQTVDYSTEFTTSTDSAAAGIFGGAFLFVWLVLAVVVVVSMWKIFEKAGRPGWVSLVPIYNTWVLAEVVGKPGWWALILLAAGIPVVGWIAALVVSIILSIELAKSFGKEPAYAALLILLPVVGYPMLAFGDAKYVGAGGKPGANPTTT